MRMGLRPRSDRRGLVGGCGALSLVLLAGCAADAGSECLHSDLAEVVLHLVVEWVAIPAGSDDPDRDRRLFSHPELAQHEMDPWP